MRLTDVKEKKALELIGIANDRRTQVLRAISNRVIEYGSPVGINEISDELQSTIGERIANPLIYRYLRSLEEDNLIIKTQIRPAKYWINLEGLILAVEHLYHKKLRELQSRVEEIKELKAKISRIDVSRIADKIISKTINKAMVRKPMSIIGAERILNLISREIYSCAKKGDIVRICMDWVDVPIEVELQHYQMVIEALKRGAEVRALSTIKWPANDEPNEMRKQDYRRLKRRYKVSYRYLSKQLHSYQFVAKNNESFVIILANRPHSAVWIPEGQRFPIVNDAINVFDEDWERAIDMLRV